MSAALEKPVDESKSLQDAANCLGLSEAHSSPQYVQRRRAQRLQPLAICLIELPVTRESKLYILPKSGSANQLKSGKKCKRLEEWEIDVHNVTYSNR